MTDIQAMFHRVRVPEGRNALRYLWWDSEKLEGPLLEYRICVHLFGATFSPSCAAFALNRAVLDKGKSYVDVAKEAKQSPELLVTDPYLRGSVEIDAGRRRIQTFEMSEQRFTDKSDCAVDCVQLSLKEPSLQRTIGLNWNLKEGSYRFHVQPMTSLATRRNQQRPPN
ncbi:hypothetical protein X801_06924, partial [Opisthorchis viverrini]